jgi:hypothetical protein
MRSIPPRFLVLQRGAGASPGTGTVLLPHDATLAVSGEPAPRAHLLAPGGMPGFFVALSGLTAFTAIAGRLGRSVIDTRTLSVCIFRSATGLPCIFCGMTHAVVYALRGDWTLASQSNPAWWLILPSLLILAAGVITGRARIGWPIVALIVATTALRAWLS